MCFGGLINRNVIKSNGCGPEATSIMELAWGYSHLATVACQDHTLAASKLGFTLFLHNHDGVAVVFTDFQLNALGFVH